MEFAPRRAAVGGVVSLALLACAEAKPGTNARVAGPHDTLGVAAPSGVTDVDRANIQAVLDSVRPGQVVLFDAGTYVLGPYPAR